MPNHMYLIITLKKPITTQEQGEAAIALVKNKLADQPDVTINANIGTSYPHEEPT